MTKLLVLDVEGTIRAERATGQVDSEGFPVTENYIDPKLSHILSSFHKADFIIVLATGTSKDTLDTYRQMFEEAGIALYIDAYAPNAHADEDGKHNKVIKYAEQYSIVRDDVYFFDDGEPNVNRVRDAGFIHAYQVGQGNQIDPSKPLVMQLESLAKELKIEIIPSHAASSSYTPGFHATQKQRPINAATPLLNDGDNPEKCCSCVIL